MASKSKRRKIRKSNRESASSSSLVPVHSSWAVVPYTTPHRPSLVLHPVLTDILRQFSLQTSSDLEILYAQSLLSLIVD